MRNKKIVISDLDGTLIKVNSFPLWIKFLLKKSVFHLNLGLLLRLCYFLVLRKIFRLSHYKFKQALIQLNYDKQYDIDFADELVNHLNTQVVLKLLELSNQVVVISTAAPERYARYLTRILPFKVNSIHASHIEEQELFDNVGENKLNSFHKMYSGQRIDVFFTDHYEDIPLLNISEYNYLVNPSHTSQRIIDEKEISYEILQ